MAPLKDDTLLIPRIVARFSTTNNKVAFRVLLSQGRRNIGVGNTYTPDAPDFKIATKNCTYIK